MSGPPGVTPAQRETLEKFLEEGRRYRGAWFYDDAADALDALLRDHARLQEEREAIARMEKIGRLGLTVSVCCGPSGAAPFGWSVQVLSRTGQEFDRPFAAHSFIHAIAIAELECTARGWLGP
jgi:hypothetical protein